MELKSWQIVLVVVGIFVVISGPSVIIAWLKLRKRNLAPILGANGWAVNARARMTVPFGASLTRVASLPPNADRDLTDPFAEKRSPWPALIVFALLLWLAGVLANRMGYVHEWTNGRLGSPRQIPTAILVTDTNLPAEAVKPAK